MLPAPRLEAAAAKSGSKEPTLMYGSRQQRLVAVCISQQQYLQAHASRAARVADSTRSMLERATSSACKLTRVATDAVTMNGGRAAFRSFTRRLLCLHGDACRLSAPSDLRKFAIAVPHSASSSCAIGVRFSKSHGTRPASGDGLQADARRRRRATPSGTPCGSENNRYLFSDPG